MANGVITQEIDLNSYFLMRTYTIDNISINANGTSSNNYDTSVNGYYPICLLSVESANASSSGTLTSYTSFGIAYLNTDNGIFQYRIQNHNLNSAAKVRVTFTVLYRRI